jgi:hypothetical protein
MGYHRSRLTPAATALFFALEISATPIGASKNALQKLHRLR